jgi:hypothetical protein
MLPLVISLALAVASPGDDKPSSPGQTPPKPHPLAPSLRATTEEDEDKFDRIIDRFIEYDTGKLKGPEAKKALEDFMKLPPEAVFALIRGLNKAAAINHSCPALVIARRIGSQLKSTRDRELLTFARENVGAGVTQSRHMGVIKDLKLSATLRDSALDREKSPDLRSKP